MPSAAYQNAIISTGLAAALRMPEGRDARIEPEAVAQDILDVVWFDGVERAIEGAFGDDDDCLAFADFAVL